MVALVSAPNHKTSHLPPREADLDPGAGLGELIKIGGDSVVKGPIKMRQTHVDQDLGYRLNRRPLSRLLALLIGELARRTCRCPGLNQPGQRKLVIDSAHDEIMSGATYISETSSLLQCLCPISLLPAELRQLTTEVAICRGLGVDRTLQV